MDKTKPNQDELKNLLKEVEQVESTFDKPVYKTVYSKDGKEYEPKMSHITEDLIKNEVVDNAHLNWEHGPRDYYNTTKNYEAMTGFLPSVRHLNSGEAREVVKEKYQERVHVDDINNICARAMNQAHKQENASAEFDPLQKKQLDFEKKFFEFQQARDEGKYKDIATESKNFQVVQQSFLEFKMEQMGFKREQKQVNPNYQHKEASMEKYKKQITQSQGQSQAQSQGQESPEDRMKAIKGLVQAKGMKIGM